MNEEREGCQKDVKSCDLKDLMIESLYQALNAVWDFLDNADTDYGCLLFTKSEFDEIMKKIEDAQRPVHPEDFV